MRTIYVAGYPRSGTTWLTRLLGDVLNCPTGGSIPGDDYREPGAEGQGRPGAYVIRKGHFELVSEKGPAVPRSHVLNYHQLTTEGVVFIQRDTRDVICSVKEYWDISTIEATIRYMAIGQVVRNYRQYMQVWLAATFPHVVTSYEALWNDTAAEITRIVSELGEPLDTERLNDSIFRQSFDERKKNAAIDGVHLPLGKEYHIKFYRRGGIGGWREQFGQHDLELANSYFGSIWKAMGYV